MTLKIIVASNHSKWFLAQQEFYITQFIAQESYNTYLRKVDKFNVNL